MRTCFRCGHRETTHSERGDHPCLSYKCGCQAALVADSWILVTIERGDIMSWEGGGDWYTDGRADYIREGCDVSTWCEENASIADRTEQGQGDEQDVFKILFSGVSFNVDSGWNDASGYESPSAWVEFDSYRILEVSE